MKGGAGHDSSLDCLRGVLSLVVVLAHAWQIFIRPLDHAIGPATVVLGLSARMAVLTFFCLSGYVIAMSIASNTRRNEGFSLGDYASARAIRIVPPLLVIIVGTLAIEVALTMTGYQWAPAWDAARNIYLTDATAQLVAVITLCLAGDLTGHWLNGPLWSLIYEIRLYVLAGLCAALFLGQSSSLARVAATVALLLYTTALLSGPFDRLQALCFCAFMLGVLAFLCHRISRRTLVAAALLATAMTGAAITASLGIPISQLDVRTEWLVAQGALACLLAVGVLAVSRSLNWRMFRGSGAYSYTLYIGHFPLLLGAYFLLTNVAPTLLQGSLTYLTAAVATIGAWATLAYAGRAIERPAEQRAWLGSIRLKAGLRVRAPVARRTPP